MMKKRAFTLIELLVVMAIIGALISITMPSLGAVRRVTKKTTCQTCLREISAGLTMYLNVHNQTFPYAAQMPSEEEDLAADEIPPREPYVPLPVALEKELGARSQVFLCPADRIAMADPTYGGGRYFDKEGTSYEWFPYLNGVRLGYKGMLMGPGPRPEFFRLKDIPMVYDFEAFHGGPKMPGSQNVLWADGRVQCDNYQQERAENWASTSSPPIP